jgi:hypothetical protein
MVLMMVHWISCREHRNAIVQSFLNTYPSWPGLSRPSTIVIQSKAGVPRQLSGGHDAHVVARPSAAGR